MRQTRGGEGGENEKIKITVVQHPEMKTYDISYLTPENSCAHSAPPPKKIVAYSATPKKSCAHSGLPPQKMAQNIFNGG